MCTACTTKMVTKMWCKFLLCKKNLAQGKKKFQSVFDLRGNQANPRRKNVIAIFFFLHAKAEKKIKIRNWMEEERGGAAALFLFLSLWWKVLVIPQLNLFSFISCVAVSVEATLLVAEMLKIFVQGKGRHDTDIILPKSQRWWWWWWYVHVLAVVRGDRALSETSRMRGLPSSGHRALWKDPASAGVERYTFYTHWS